VWYSTLPWIDDVIGRDMKNGEELYIIFNCRAGEEMGRIKVT
jgi:hypothetical protein